MSLQHTNQKQVSKYCNRCFQLENNHSCIALNLPITTISINTRFPLSVIHHILKNSNVEFDDFIAVANAPEIQTHLVEEEYFKKMTKLTKEQFVAHYDNKQYKSMLYNDCLSILKDGVNLEYYLTCINTIYTNLYTNQHTKENIYVKLRKELWAPDSKEYKLSLEILKIPKEVKKQQIEHYQKQVEENNTEKKIFSYRSLVKIIDGLKNGTTREEMFLFCLFVYGGRPKDLFQNTIEPYNSNEIIVSNIAKKKKEDSCLTATRPLIGCTNTEFIRIRSKALNLYKDIYNKDNQINKTIMDALNKTFNFYYPEETIKIIRKLYGALAYREYGGKQNMNLFLKKILGHNGVEVSFSYSQIELID